MSINCARSPDINASLFEKFMGSQYIHIRMYRYICVHDTRRQAEKLSKQFSKTFKRMLSLAAGVDTTLGREADPLMSVL